MIIPKNHSISESESTQSLAAFSAENMRFFPAISA
jgi:hypothetical protein